MTRKLVFVNRKGGVGKTASAINVSAALGRRGRRTLLIDATEQQDSTQVLAPTNVRQSLYDVLLGDVAPEDAIIPTAEERLFLLPSDERFANFPTRVREANEAAPQIVMRQRLEAIEGFDYIVLDVGNSIDLAVVNALAYAQEAWIPAKPAEESLTALYRIQRLIQAIRSGFPQTTITVCGVFLTLAKPHTHALAETAGHLAEHHGDLFCQTIITDRVELTYAMGNHQSIFTYAPNSKSAEQYQALTKEIIAYEQVETTATA